MLVASLCLPRLGIANMVTVSTHLSPVHTGHANLWSQQHYYHH